MKRIKILRQFMKRNLLRYFTAILFSGIAVLVAVINPMIFSFTVDSVIGNETMMLPDWLMTLVTNYGGRETLMQKLWILSLIYIGLTLITGVFQYLKGRWVSISVENGAKKSGHNV